MDREGRLRAPRLGRELPAPLCLPSLRVRAHTPASRKDTKQVQGPPRWPQRDNKPPLQTRPRAAAPGLQPRNFVGAQKFSPSQAGITVFSFIPRGATRQRRLGEGHWPAPGHRAGRQRGGPGALGPRELQGAAFASAWGGPGGPTARARVSSSERTPRLSISSRNTKRVLTPRQGLRSLTLHVPEPRELCPWFSGSPVWPDVRLLSCDHLVSVTTESRAQPVRKPREYSIFAMTANTHRPRRRGLI